LVHVIATIELKPGVRDAFLAAFRALVPLVKAEAGCIEYGSAIDVASGSPAQIPMRPDVVTVVEKWADLDALRAHAAAPHMGAYRAQVKNLVVRTSLQVLDPA
jgi:quinol monooxygenase YgiN